MGASSTSFRLAPAILVAAVFAPLCGCSSGPNSTTTNNPPPPLTIAAISLPAGTTAIAYSAVCSASGGTPPYTWSISAGALPAGLTLSGSGTISGNPTGSGTSSFTIQVSDSSTPSQTASEQQSITVNPAAQPLAITTSSLSAGVVGASYSASLTVTGGTTPYNWSISAGSLPAGLKLNASTGAISGTPTSTGTSSFTAKVTDSSSPIQSATKALTLTITSTPPPLAISTASLPRGTVGAAYSATLGATGGSTPYSWSISSGSLPAGLNLNTSSGLISGTPTASGTSSFTVKATDSSSPVQTATQPLSITVAAAPPVLSITTSSLPGGTDGTTYSTTLTASGGTSPYTWSVSSGSLPAGLSLTAGSGLISGTPTASGTSSFTVKATDSSSPVQTATQPLSITISTSSSMISVPCLPAEGETQGGSYVNLPTCGQVNQGDLLLAVAATYPVSPQGSFVTGVTDSQGDVFQPVQGARCIDVNSGSADLWYAFSNASSGGVTATIQTGMQLEIATGSLPGGTVSDSYSGTLIALGGAPPYTWSIVSGSLPSGMSLDASTGVISGTAPATATTASFTVQVTDSAGATLPQPQAFSINIVSGTPPLQINTAFLPFYMVNPETPYSTTLAASGGAPPYTWSLGSGSLLPPGLGLNGGIISGTPILQTYDILGTPFTVQVTDSASNQTTANLTLNLPFTAGFVLQATGVDQSQPVDQVSEVSNQPASTTIPSPAITTNFSEELIVAANSCENLSTTVGSPFTFVNLGGCGAAYLVASTTGTYQASWNQTDGVGPAAGTYCSTIASFKAQ